MKLYYKKLIGEKCYLSPMNVDDYEKYVEWVNDMEVAAGMLFASQIVTKEREKELVESLSKDYNFAIVDIKGDELIGNIGFPKIDYINRVAEVGLFIGNKEFWGKGYGQEALNLALDFGFSILNMHNIYLRVYSYNKPAISCYKKVGFKEAGRIREAKRIAGERYDEIIMDILEDEYESVYIKKIVSEKNF
ncbi:GNAT family N-acetyltransferase [Thermoanaerobacterium butyriciformans]|uniref:GNAT family N-acetyltransferase n=1 Tax=Thermoanaerobacterium butyriciformans TaxID=1702242 RepID=UPI001FD8C1D6|nr:GNAT family protein [Thermoanaerobacterium butyriciformans]